MYEEVRTGKSDGRGRGAPEYAGVGAGMEGLSAVRPTEPRV